MWHSASLTLPPSHSSGPGRLIIPPAVQALCHIVPAYMPDPWRNNTLGHLITRSPYPIRPAIATEKTSFFYAWILGVSLYCKVNTRLDTRHTWLVWVSEDE